MICVVDCSKCKHAKPLKNGWRSCCDAFPEGIPFDFDYSKIQESKECNNGIGFEPKTKN